MVPGVPKQIKQKNEYLSLETVVQRCSLKKEKVFLKILQNLQENTCARVSFWIKLQFLTDWRNMRRKNTIELSSVYWNVILWIFLNWYVNWLFHPALASWSDNMRKVGARWDPGCTKVGSRLAGMKLFTCNRSTFWRVYNTAGILAKQDRISSRPTGIM